MAKVALGSDHAGYPVKGRIAELLRASGDEVVDCGTDSDAPVDYPSFCIAVGEAVAEGRADWGIVLGGSGQGEQMAANKVCGVRAALCDSPYYALLARRDNDANVLALGARVVAFEHVTEIIRTWKATAFEGGRHARRIGLIAAYEAHRKCEHGD